VFGSVDELDPNGAMNNNKLKDSVEDRSMQEKHVAGEDL
jgi:hypothetical protein